MSYLQKPNSNLICLTKITIRRCGTYNRTLVPPTPKKRFPIRSINRLGTVVIFSVIGGLLTVDCVLVGWNHRGIVGAAYGFLIARIANVAQDLLAIRLFKAGGWLDVRTWEKVAAQGLVAAIFASTYLFLKKDSYWLLFPTMLHGGLVAFWILRRQLLKLLGSTKSFQSS